MMNDVGNKKVGFSDAAAGVVQTLIILLTTVFIFLEVSSRFDTRGAVGILYRQAQCRVRLPILQSRMDALFARSDDVMRELDHTRYELVVAEGEVSECLRGDIKDKKIQSGLVQAIAKRDRIAAEVQELFALMDDMSRARENVEHAHRWTKVEMAKLEASLYAP